MNEKEDYFRFERRGTIHVLSDRLPFRWREVLILSSTSLFGLIFILGFLAGILSAVIMIVGYILYRFASWIFYLEIEIDEISREMTCSKLVLGKRRISEIITNDFDPINLEFVELSRSGKNKFLMRYRTHKIYDLIILKNKADKNKVKTYISDFF